MEGYYEHYLGILKLEASAWIRFSIYVHTDKNTQELSGLMSTTNPKRANTLPYGLCIYRHIYILLALTLRRSRNDDNSVPKSAPCTQILFSKYHSAIKDIWLLEKNAWYGESAKKKSWNILYCQEVRKYAKIITGTCQKDISTNLKGFTQVKSGTI